MQRCALLLMLEEALVRPWMALMTLMAGVRTPSPMIMDVASSTTVSSRPRATLLCLRSAPTCGEVGPMSHLRQDVSRWDGSADGGTFDREPHSDTARHARTWSALHC